MRWVQADLSVWDPGTQFDLVTTHYAHPAMPQLDFYDRIAHDNNRPGKVALIAVMRKILVIANAVARDHLKAQRQSA